MTPDSPSLALGLSLQFTATGSFSDGSTGDITTTVTWESSDTLVATIDVNGLATALAVGTADLTSTLDSITSNSATLTVT